MSIVDSWVMEGPVYNFRVSLTRDEIESADWTYEEFRAKVAEWIKDQREIL